MKKIYQDGLTGQQRFDRMPEDGWDAAIDIRQGRKYLRERGDTVRQIFEGAISAAELMEGKKAPTKEDVIKALEEDLSPYVIHLRRFGLRPRTVAKMLKRHFYGRMRVEPYFNMGLLKKLIQFVYVENHGRVGIDSMAGERVPDGMAFKTNAQGTKLNSPENIAIAFVRLGIGLRYDKFADRYMIDGLPGFGPLLDDAAVQRIRFDISRKYGFLPERQMTFDFCYDTARYYSFDPVLDYFDKVQEKWDGKPRIETFLTDYAGAADTPYVRAVSTLIFLSVVRRNREPGAKFDEMIVLESSQGKDKSSALRVMALNDDWFGDSFPMDADERKTLEHGQGKLIIEVAELQGIRRSDIESVKAMLSRRIDEGRLAYAKNHTKQPRRFIFVGTSNGDTYLQDDTGNRRFWPVKVEAFDLKNLKRDIDQLWGEAAGREALGFSIRMDQALWDQAGEQQDARLAFNDDPFTHEFQFHLGDKTGRITAADAWAILGVEAGRRTPELQRRFGGALRAIGWKRHTIRLEPGREGRRVAGYGNGDDTRLLVVTRGYQGRVSVDYEDQDNEGVSGQPAADWPDAAE